MLINKTIKFTELHYYIFKLLSVIHPHWKLTDTELIVLSELYNENYRLSKIIKDNKLKMDTLFSVDSRKNIMTKLDLSYNTFNNVLTSLRKKEFIVDNSLNDKFTQSLNSETFNFNIKLINASNS